MATTQTEPILTNLYAGEAFVQANGLGNYSIVREQQGCLVSLPSTPTNEELRARAIEDMQNRRAGGWFGADDEGQWYPIAQAIAHKLCW